MGSVFRSIILLLTALFAVDACAANPRLLRFDTPEHDLGTIQEADGTVALIFEFVNISQTPVVVTDVRSTCSCTIPSYSRDAIKPGEKGVVNVIFDPKDLDGDLSKSLVVVADNGSYRKFSTLTLRGSVIGRTPALERNFPCILSAALRSQDSVVGMRQIAADTLSSAKSIQLINTSDKLIRLGARCESNCVIVYLPATLEPRQSVEMQIVVDGCIAPEGTEFCSEVYLTTDSMKTDIPIRIKGVVSTK